MIDPRTTIRYERMIEVIDLLDGGPQTLEDICGDLDITHQQFKDARYSLPGRLAMEDRDVVVPRPLAMEGYVYKLAATYKSGSVNDGEPNLQMATSDLLSRVATIYMDVERLVTSVPGRSTVRRMLRKLQKALDLTLDSVVSVAEEAGVPVAEWPQHVLDHIA